MSPDLRSAELGDPAPALEIADWVKGGPVDLAAGKGKTIYVIEFWATWCGPCRTSIPHLTEVQAKFKDKGVVVIGVSDETLAKVQPFVDNMGDKMDYAVAIDKNRQTSRGYMEAFGINGIPHAFIVNREGRLAWHGHPMAGLDKALDQMVGGKFDMGTEKKRAAARKKLEEFFELASSGEDEARMNTLAKEVEALDKELGGIEPGEKFDATEIKKVARFQGLMRDYQRALFAGKSDADLEKIEKEAGPYAPQGFRFADFRQQFQLQRLFSDYYRAATGKGDEAKAGELAQKLGAVESQNAEVLNEIAWTLLTDEKLKKRDLKLAVKFAQAAYDATAGKDANILDTYARALFDTGKIADAVKQQKRAVELCDDKERKAEFAQTLKRYQERAER